MNATVLMTKSDYDPDKLLDALKVKMNLRNDAALSRFLSVTPPVISKIRHRKLPVGASLLIRMHEISGLNIRDLRNLMGDRRNNFRVSAVQGMRKHKEQTSPMLTHYVYATGHANSNISPEITVSRSGLNLPDA